ncbi:MAG: biotin--[acetyl-CoA-carboxylase] ligase [Bacteriovoracaceae bacterium]
MIQLHFQSLGSTQTYLIENLSNLVSKDRDVLVSTDRQTDGIGRSGAQWIDFKNNLALSFTLYPTDPITLTSLECAVLISKFFQLQWKIDLNVKWPNDLMNSKQEKCGGIILHNSNNIIICGVGINLDAKKHETEKVERDSSKPAIGSLLNEDLSSDLNKKEISNNIYEFILNNRLSKEEIMNSWSKRCHHLNQFVRIYDNPTRFVVGYFRGIGSLGEALVETSPGKIEKIYSGSLVINEKNLLQNH